MECQLTLPKHLAQFVRTHEKALANAIQLRRQPPGNGESIGRIREDSPNQGNNLASPAHTFSSSNALAAFSLGYLNFSSQNVKPAKLTLTPHHLYYLLDQFEEIGIPVGPMKVRLENIHAEASPANYVSFLGESQRSRGRSDHDSIHSISSVRSVMSGMSQLWSSFGLSSSNSAAKIEKAKAQSLTDLKYLYSAFTKIPCLRLTPDLKAHLIGGYEEFPFDTAVPLIAFKNLSVLEICDVDFRQFYGWDRLADQLRSLTVKRSNLDDPSDLLVNVVLDDMDKRRRRSSKIQSSPVLPWPLSPSLQLHDSGRTNSTPPSPLIDERFVQSALLKCNNSPRGGSEALVVRHRPRTKSTSPSRPSSSRQEGSYRHIRANQVKVKRSGSGSSNSSTHSSGPLQNGSSSNLLTMGILPASKWRFLRHLSLADNSLTSLTVVSLGPLSSTLHSLDLSSNLFAEVPDCLASLTALRALNISNCMIESLHSLTKIPPSAITALNLRANRLTSIAGVERLLSLERLDLRENRIQDPTELARLTGIPNIYEIWVLKNPFIKTHSNYRVTIFNLFRNTSGYSKDIKIDTSAPRYSERKQLSERIAEPEGVPPVNINCVEPVLDTFPSTNRTRSLEDGTETRVPQRPSPPAMNQSEISVGSGRRRKGQRRRIVDLAKDESTTKFGQHNVPIDIPLGVQYPDLTREANEDVSPKTHPIWFEPSQVHLALASPKGIYGMDSSRGAPPDISDRGRSLATEIKNSDFNGEVYRQKIEALKSEVGSNWLSVLSEEGWQKHQDMPTSGPIQRDYVGLTKSERSGFRTTNQGIVSGARTLG